MTQLKDTPVCVRLKICYKTQAMETYRQIKVCRGKLCNLTLRVIWTFAFSPTLTIHMVVNIISFEGPSIVITSPKVS